MPKKGIIIGDTDNLEDGGRVEHEKITHRDVIGRRTPCSVFLNILQVFT